MTCRPIERMDEKVYVSLLFLVIYYFILYLYVFAKRTFYNIKSRPKKLGIDQYSSAGNN